MAFKRKCVGTFCYNKTYQEFLIKTLVLLNLIEYLVFVIGIQLNSVSDGHIITPFYPFITNHASHTFPDVRFSLIAILFIVGQRFLPKM